MDDVLQFALIGLGLGAMYSLASQGLVLIYRGSGVLNFAHGAIGMLGAYAFYEVRSNLNQPFLVAALAGIAVSAIVGALTQVLIMRHLKRASPLARTVATLGVLLTIQSIAVLRYGGRATFVAPDLPQGQVLGLEGLTMDRLIMLIIAIVLTVVLWATYRYSRFGLRTTAVAENELAAASVGISAERIATINWAAGSALAGLAAILISPIVTLQVSVMTNLVLAAMAAALIAGFRSFPIAFVAGLALGVLQTVLQRYSTDVSGVDQALPFVAIVVVLMVRGKSLPLRDFVLQKLPMVGSGRIRLQLIIPVLVALGVATFFVPPRWQDAVTITVGAAIIILSVVLLTGYGGQLSLGQFALAGFGAWVAGRLIAVWNVPFELAFAAGVIATIPVGMLFALPAVRTRGISLAVVTLGLGSALEFMVFNSSFLTGGFAGTPVGQTHLFGLNISAIAEPFRYAIFAILVLTILTLAVANIRRGRSGRKLIAVRTNERAAAALGINVPAAKLYAFGVASAIAAAGGIILAFRSEQIVYGQLFTSFQSISVVGWGMIGGIGYLLGPLFGATLAPGSIGAAALGSIPGDFATYLPLISGLLIILFMLMNQNGVAKEMSGNFANMLPQLAAQKPRPPLAESTEARAIVVPPKTLAVEGLTVRYGGTVAVNDVSFTVEPGKVLGLIGPNGAGKTSIIDAVTGFTLVSAGTIRLDGVDMTRQNATRRARAGVGRSFQSLELFEDVTVRDNLLTAADPHENSSYVREIFWPRKEVFSATAVEAIREFRLEADLDTVVQDLPYGKRRLVALARAVAMEPSVLLLDEPAAGLSEIESRELASLVSRLAKNWGLAVLLVEHDMDFVMGICDDIIVVDFGNRIAAGTSAEIQQDELVRAAYLGGEVEHDIDEIVAAEAVTSREEVTR